MGSQDYRWLFIIWSSEAGERKWDDGLIVVVLLAMQTRAEVNVWDRCSDQMSTITLEHFESESIDADADYAA